MPPPTMLALDDALGQDLNGSEWQGFKVFPRENPSPSYNNFLVKKAATPREKSTDTIFSRSSERDDSFRIVLPPAMPPPRDSAVPLPVVIEPKKLSRQKSMRKSHYKEEDFRRNTFCLCLPGFGKPKPVRSSSSSKGQVSMEKNTMIRSSSFTNSTVSISASLERFECGSWASTLTNDNGRFCFHLPVEMMKRNNNISGNRGRDLQEPVSYGFLFDKETETLASRSVLKRKSSRSSRRDHRRSVETSPLGRVRFPSSSVSCPTSPRHCITPRLRKARDDFNTFLSEQNS
ncbi:unnamed protein product [Cochlearia groenlandica]